MPLTNLKKAPFTLVLLTLSFCFSGNEVAYAQVHRSKGRLLDIEVPTSQIFLKTKVINPEEKLCLVTFSVVHGDMIHEFVFRKAWPQESCEDFTKSYLALMEGVPTTRIVGVEPFVADLGEWRNPFPDPIVQLLKKPQPRKLVIWYFHHLQTRNGCKSYFAGDCNPYDLEWDLGSDVIY